MADIMFQEAIDAVHAGQKMRARDLLTRLLRADQNNPDYWVWMSAVVDGSKEQIFCLQSALRIQADHNAALRGLRLLGIANFTESLPGAVYRKRNWQAFYNLDEEKTGYRSRLANPAIRVLLTFVLLLLVGGMFWGGVYGYRQISGQAALLPTRTKLVGAPPTFTPTPTFIELTPVVVHVTPSPTFIGPTPLWMLLKATYTITPFYVNTPHPITEAFRLGMREFSRGNWEKSITYFNEAALVDVKSPDLHYHIGEAQRMLGDFEAALVSYNQALEINANFAPAYLGRGRVMPLLDGKADAVAELNAAVELDPKLGEAYIERIKYFLQNNLVEDGRADLAVLQELLPDSPLVPLYKAQLLLAERKYREALPLARLALKRDQTMLPAYITLASAAVANNVFADTVQAANTYVRFTKDDPIGWMLLGQGYAGIPGISTAIWGEATRWSNQDFEKAKAALNKAIELDQSLVEAYIFQAILSLSNQEGQEAVNFLFQARQLDSTSFVINLAFGRALFTADRLSDALAQVNASESLVDGDLDIAAVYYWRAQILEAAGNDAAAATDWTALIELDNQAIPESWINLAITRLATATPTVSLTPTPSKTPVLTRATLTP